MTAPLMLRCEQTGSPLLTTRIAARRLGVSLSAVQLWCASGEMRTYRTPGGHRRIPEADVRRMEERMRSHASHASALDAAVIAAAEEFAAAIESLNRAVASNGANVDFANACLDAADRTQNALIDAVSARAAAMRASEEPQTTGG